MIKYIQEFLNILSFRNLADHTIQSYEGYVEDYLTYVETHLQKKPEDVEWAEIREYLNKIQFERNLADSTINSIIAQLKNFTISVLRKRWDKYQVPTKKIDRYLPYVMSKEKTFEFIETIPDLRLKAIVSLIYSAGLRISEACRLTYDDLSSSEKTIRIKKSKGRAEQVAILSDRAVENFLEYWRSIGRPREGYLFPQKRNPKKPVPAGTIARHIHDHEDRLGWERKITPHTFRHCFGTHAYQDGTDLLTIKELLRHRSLNSTLIYIHLAGFQCRNIVSPFDVPVRGGSNGAS